MNISHLVVLLARLFAATMAIYTASLLLSNLAFYSLSGNFPVAVLVFYPAAFLMSIVIWFMPFSFVRLLTGYRGSIETEVATTPTAEQIAAIAFATLALFLLYDALSDAAYWWFYYRYTLANEYVQFAEDHKAAVAATVVKAVFAVILMVGRQKLFMLILKLRQS